MNNHTLRGLALFFIFALNLTVFGNPVRNVSTVSNSQSNNVTTTPSATENTATPDAGSTATSSRVPGNDVLSPRWILVDQSNNLATLAFTSSNAINQAVTMLGDVSGALSYTNFGRVPFYQYVVVPSNDKMVTASRISGTLSTAVPEPMSLLLLGSGLAVLGIANRKKSRQ